jgi:hypothetical protein
MSGGGEKIGRDRVLSVLVLMIRCLYFDGSFPDESPSSVDVARASITSRLTTFT